MRVIFCQEYSSNALIFVDLAMGRIPFTTDDVATFVYS